MHVRQRCNVYHSKLQLPREAILCFSVCWLIYNINAVFICWLSLSSTYVISLVLWHLHVGVSVHVLVLASAMHITAVTINTISVYTIIQIRFIRLIFGEQICCRGP